MANTDQITPALTAEEWAEIRSGNFQLDDIIARPFATIAALNHTAPDDSPYKITRADLQAIEKGLVGIDCVISEFCCNDAERRATKAESNALAVTLAKLNALLPP